jgi:hypothetical protein
MCFTSVGFNFQNELGVINEPFNHRNTEDYIDFLDEELAASNVFTSKTSPKGAHATQQASSFQQIKKQTTKHGL